EALEPFLGNAAAMAAPAATKVGSGRMPAAGLTRTPNPVGGLKSGSAAKLPPLPTRATTGGSHSGSRPGLPKIGSNPGRPGLPGANPGTRTNPLLAPPTALPTPAPA